MAGATTQAAMAGVTPLRGRPAARSVPARPLPRNPAGERKPDPLSQAVLLPVPVAAARPRIVAPVGKSGPGTNVRIWSVVAFGCAIK